MNAVVFDERLHLAHDYPQPQRRSGEALVRVSVAGVCNTDLEIAGGYMGFTGILGHEFVGTVIEADEPDLVGRRVVGEINLPCQTCEYCRSGLGNHCPNRTVLGILGKNGAFAELLTLPANNLHEVPEGVSDEEAVFTEPLAACFEILEQVDIQLHRRALVCGDGKLGLLAVQVLARAGCEVALVGRHQSKMSIARSLGIKTIASGQTLPEKVGLVVECTGSPSGFAEALRMVKPRGTLVLKSTVAGSHNLHLAPVVIDEINLIGSRCGPFPPALRALAEHQIDVLSMITARYHLIQGLEAIDHARAKGAVKVLLTAN